MSAYFEPFVDADGELRPALFERIPEISPLLDGGPHALRWDHGGWFWGSRDCRVGPFLDIGLAAAAADMAVIAWLSDQGFRPQMSTGGLGPDGKVVEYNVRIWIDGPGGTADSFFAKTRAAALNAAAHVAKTHLMDVEEV